MTTNIALDKNLLRQATKSGGHKTKRATVNEALPERMQRRSQLEIIELFGKIDYGKTHHNKKHRKRR